jgi:beta-glucosidase
VAHDPFGVRGDLHFSIEARQTNKNGSLPLYKDPQASIEARVDDLLPRMTLEEKVSQLWVDMSLLYVSYLLNLP